MLISIETYNTCDFPGGVWTPSLPSGSVHARFLYMLYKSAKTDHRRSNSYRVNSGKFGRSA